MNIKESIAAKRREFDIAVSLLGVLPMLVMVYLITERIANIHVFVGEVGYVVFCTIIVFLLGMVVGRKMFMSVINELIEMNRMAAIVETAMTLSHEINNPLLAISGNLELMETDLLPPTSKERFEKIKDGFQRIRQATEKLARISKPTTYTVHGDITMIDINKSASY